MCHVNMGYLLSNIAILDYLPTVLRRVSDPYLFFPDPDPAFETGDQSGSGSNPDPGL
jgi:hypothetical protein